MFRLLAAAGAAAVLSLAAPAAAFAHPGSQALARGTVSEVVSGGDWHISFDIHARDHGWNSGVTVHTVSHQPRPARPAPPAPARPARTSFANDINITSMSL
jgi:hypothetical protein